MYVDTKAARPVDSLVSGRRQQSAQRSLTHSIVQSVRRANHYRQHFLLLLLVVVFLLLVFLVTMAQQEDPAVTNFRDYIRINTMHPNVDYGPCTEFLKKQGKELGAEVKVFELHPDNPIVIFTLPGTDPSLPSILLNSHTDVVPVFPEHWKYDPFSAHKDDKGDIYGRGTQDMKCVGMQYIEALKKLKRKGERTFLRTVHLSFVPDEETSGYKGMDLLAKSEEFKKLNVGFALDEGYASEDDNFFVFNGERSPWNLWVRCQGEPGHGSQFIKDTAAEKLRKVVDSFLALRDAEEQRLKTDPKLSLGDVITVNMTMLEGGIQFNVVPADLSVGFNIRVPPSVDFDELEARFRGWCQQAGEGVTMEFDTQVKIPQTTCVEDGKGKWWDAFSAACKKEKIKVLKQIFPGATDSRFLRKIGIPAIGFSPMNNTPLLLHDHNEFLNENIYLRGIDIYCSIIPAVANVEA